MEGEQRGGAKQRGDPAGAGARCHSEPSGGGARAAAVGRWGWDGARWGGMGWDGIGLDWIGLGVGVGTSITRGLEWSPTRAGCGVPQGGEGGTERHAHGGGGDTEGAREGRRGGTHP